MPARQRQSAFRDILGIAVLGRVLHNDDNLFDAGDKIHRATHALDHFAGNHPVGDIAILSRSEEHTSELQSLMRISYAVFCLKKKIRKAKINSIHKLSLPIQFITNTITNNLQE